MMMTRRQQKKSIIHLADGTESMDDKGWSKEGGNHVTRHIYNIVERTHGSSSSNKADETSYH